MLSKDLLNEPKDLDKQDQTMDTLGGSLPIWWVKWKNRIPFYLADVLRAPGPFLNAIEGYKGAVTVLPSNKLERRP